MNVSAEIAAKKAGSTVDAGLPVASVVLLTYNHEPHIRRSIEGFLQQKTSFPFEVLVGEDCSKDRTREIVLEYAKAHPEIIRAVVSEQNVGAHENLRRCELLARGRYMCYCDGDDYWTDPENLERQVMFLESHPDYVMVHNAFRFYYTLTGKTVEQPMRLAKDLDDADAYNELLSGKRHILPLTVCIRRSVQDVVLKECPECYDSRFLMGDTQRWLELARRGKVKYFDKTVATRQVLLESMSQSRNPQRVLRFALSNQQLFDHYIEKYDCAAEARRSAKARCAYHVLTSACDAGNFEVAKAALAEYRKAGASVPLEGYLYYFGSRSSALRPAVKSAVEAINLVRKASRRLTGLLAPA